MKKIILWLLGIIIALIGLIGLLLFTPQGNALLKPIIQSQIDKYAPIKLDLDTFSLGFSDIDVLIRHNDDILITLNGNFSLFSQMLDLNLKVDAKDISSLGELVNTPLQGSFIINTTIQGQLQNLAINTTSDIAKSFTNIRVILRDFAPSLVYAQIKDAQVKELLAMAEFKPYANGLLSLNIDLKQEENLNGNVFMQITQGNIDRTLIKKDFQIEVPKTTFNLSLNAFLETDEIQHELNFNSNVGNIHINGQTKPLESYTTTKYDIKLKDLSTFTPLAGMPIRGSFNTQGVIQGNIQSLLTIQGDSDLASSNTTYVLTLENLAPSLLKLQSKNLQLNTLLWMIHMPQYASMKLNVDSQVSDLTQDISTSTSVQLSGITNNAVIKEEMGLDMPNTDFSLVSKISLEKGVGEANSSIKSDIASIDLQKTAIDLQKMTFEGQYSATIPNLKKLKFLTGIELIGRFDGNGKAKLTDSLYVDFKTQSLGGSIDAKLENNKLYASLKDLNTFKLFTMAQFPLVFDSDVNGSLEYDTLAEKGTLKAMLNNGKLQSNKLTELVAQYLKTDLTKEVYNDAGLDATINKKRITTDIDLKSNNTIIHAQKASIDLEDDSINADLKLQIKDKYVYVKAREKISSPSINIDASDLIKAEVTKAISKEVNKALDKHLKDEKLKEGTQKLLKNLF